MEQRIFPLGIQDFEKLRSRNAIYVDKTALIYKLVHELTVCFLARPRRFGKSLLVSTLRAYFEGRKDLFRGLAVEQLEHDWIEHPVLHFDFSGVKYLNGAESLSALLNWQLSLFEKKYEIISGQEQFGVRMTRLLHTVAEKTGQKVVILIDEYDAPLLDLMGKDEPFQKTRDMMRDFYSPIKQNDALLQFVFLTGITKFSQLSIFSEFNNLKHLSMDSRYDTICGISKDEMLTNFGPEIEAMAETNGWSFDETIAKLKKKYDGYHFSETSPDIFNPFSLLNSLDEHKLGNYWFSSGTPTFLAQQISLHPNIDVEKLDQGFWTSREIFDMPAEKSSDIIPLLYQSGYLTIKDYDSEMNMYKLGYPNEEVRIGFSKCLMPFYANNSSSDNESFSVEFVRSLAEHNIDRALTLARSFLSSIPYNALRKKEDYNEHYYRTLLLLMCRFVTPYTVRAEHANAVGRSDLLIEMKDAVFCFEFKKKESPEKAIQQIDEKGYLISFEADHKKLYKIGVQFDFELRTIGDWVIATR